MTEKTTGPTVVSPRALFVDDEEMNRKLLTLQLAPSGFEVVACASGDDALVRVGEQAFDLAILDVMMPGMDGIELCRRLRARGHKFPVLFMSGWPDQETRERARMAGGDAFLPRPYRREQLIAAIDELMGRDRH